MVKYLCKKFKVFCTLMSRFDGSSFLNTHNKPGASTRRRVVEALLFLQFFLSLQSGIYYDTYLLLKIREIY